MFNNCEMARAKIFIIYKYVQWKGPPLHVQNRYAFGILPVGVVMCPRAVEHDAVTSSDLSVAVQSRDRLAQ